ncbi:MAG: hypothetical protein AVDCRST_MAG22-3675, partial [uncultured Rubrobacteraceae bacterium]
DLSASAWHRARLRVRLHVREVALSRAFRAPDHAGRTEQRGRPDHPRPRLHGRRHDLRPHSGPHLRRRPAPPPQPRRGRELRLPSGPQPRARAPDGHHLRHPDPARLRLRHPPARRRPRPPEARPQLHPLGPRRRPPHSLVHSPRPAPRGPRRPLPLPAPGRRPPAPLHRWTATPAEDLRPVRLL